MKRPSHTLHRGALAGLAAALLAAGCSKPPPSADLFPLESGHRWTYRQLTLMDDDSRDDASLVMRTLPSEDFEGTPAFRRRSDDGVNYWIKRDETGIRRIASGYELAKEPTRDEPGRYVLKEPLVVGTEWQATTIPYLLKRRQGFPQELRHEGKQVMMGYRIEALKETVTVPAGRYEGCLKVRGQASLRLYADAVAGWKDIPLTTHEWYCPGPGLVKMERLEPANSPYLTGGKFTLELLEWDKG